MSEPDQSEVKPGLRTVRYGARGSLVRVIREFGAASRWKGNLVATDMWRAPLESRPPTPPHGARASKSSKGAQRRPRLVYGRRTRLPQRMNELRFPSSLLSLAVAIHELGVRSSFLSLAVALALSLSLSLSSARARQSGLAVAPHPHCIGACEVSSRAAPRNERNASTQRPSAATLGPATARVTVSPRMQSCHSRAGQPHRTLAAHTTCRSTRAHRHPTPSPRSALGSRRAPGASCAHGTRGGVCLAALPAHSIPAHRHPPPPRRGALTNPDVHAVRT